MKEKQVCSPVASRIKAGIVVVLSMFGLMKLTGCTYHYHCSDCDSEKNKTEIVRDSVSALQLDNEIQGSCITNSEIIQNNGYLFIYGDSHDAKGKKKKVIVDPGKDDNKKDDNSGNEQDKPCPCEDEKASCDTCKSLVAYSRIVNATYANGGIHK